MKYYLDTEFDGMGGRLLSLALVSEKGDHLYLVESDLGGTCEWVAANVVPIMHCAPVTPQILPVGEWPAAIEKFLTKHTAAPTIIADWPDDIRYFCECLITGPGTMIDIPGLRCEVVRVDAYPTVLQGAVQHNAWWDAYALRVKLTGDQQ